MTPEAASPRSSKPKNPRALDDIDRHILELLVEDGRMSNHALAQSASIAESTGHARVAALVSSGVIRGFHAEVDPVAIGLPIQAQVLVRLQASARPRLREEAMRLANCPGVVEVFFLAGQHDLLVRVAVADADHLRDFVVYELNRHPEIAATETSMVLEHLRGHHLLRAG